MGQEKKSKKKKRSFRAHREKIGSEGRGGVKRLTLSTKGDHGRKDKTPRYKVVETKIGLKKSIK